MTIQSIRIYRYSIPMIPFTISSGSMHYAQNTLIELYTNEGLIGLGECSAFPMIAGETQDTCLALARDFAKIWKGKSAHDIEDRMKELDRFVVGNHTIKSAFDMALFDLAAKFKEQPLYQYLGGHYFEPETDLTIGINEPGIMASQAVDFVQNKRANILKVKLGKNAAEDIERMVGIRAAIGPDIKLRIDANQGWDYEDAVYALMGMQELGIEFCEQPMHKLLDEKMHSLRRITTIPLMADESVFDHHDADRMIKNKGCDYINIKLSKAGGIQEALLIHDKCAAADVPNMLGGMLESRLALSANVHLALAGSNILFYDLDTCLLGHLEDPVMDGVQFDGMKLKLPSLPGIGASVDPLFLKNCEQFCI